MQQAGTVSAFTLAAMLLVAGCLAPSTGTPTVDDGDAATSTVTAATPRATPAPLDSLPSVPRCLTDAVPRPDSVDGVEPSAYPEPPAAPTHEAVVGWVREFETAYFRNSMLADSHGDDMNLTEVSASVEVRETNRTARGDTVRLSDFGATNYASDIHGDHWADVGYVVTETRVVRVPLEDRSDPIHASAGTVVVECR
jgi:hypothetical protein